MMMMMMMPTIVTERSESGAVRARYIISSSGSSTGGGGNGDGGVGRTDIIVRLLCISCRIIFLYFFPACSRLAGLEGAFLWQIRVMHTRNLPISLFLSLA